MTPAGSITFLPKIHGPVSTTTKLPPASLVDSSTLPMLPSSASTLKPVKSTDGAVLLNVQISAIVICLNPFAKALAFDRVHDLLGTSFLALRPCAKHEKSLQTDTYPTGLRFVSPSRRARKCALSGGRQADRIPGILLPPSVRRLDLRGPEERGLVMAIQRYEGQGQSGAVSPI